MCYHDTVEKEGAPGKRRPLLFSYHPTQRRRAAQARFCPVRLGAGRGFFVPQIRRGAPAPTLKEQRGQAAGLFMQRMSGSMGSNSRTRPDRNGPHRAQFEANRKIILATQSICAICGKPVDKSLKYPDPMSPTVDHIIPISRNGDPSALENLQLAHRACNRAKSDRLVPPPGGVRDRNRDLPLSADWKNF